MLQPALSRCEELGLTVVGLSDADVDVLISALGEGKILTELSVEESSLSPESVEQVLSALSRQSVGEVRLSVTTITVTTAALCLDFIQKTETCHYLMLQGSTSPPKSLSVVKDSRSLRLTLVGLSNADVDVLISALGEVKILTDLSVYGSSLSPESVEQVLNALSRQSVGEVRLSVMTITVTTAALCLDFMQNTKTCHYLMLEDNSWPLSSLSVKKDSSGLGLNVESLSDADVGVLISTLGDGKILIGLSVEENSLSPESVEQILSFLSRQKSVGKVHLSVVSFTVNTAALCLDIMQNTETCRHLWLTDSSWPQSLLFVDKDSRRLGLQGKSLLSPTMSLASLTLSQANSPTSGSFTDFIHKFRDVTGLRANPHRSPGDRIGVLESLTDWCTLPGLETVKLKVPCLTESWAHWILNLIHTCPTLKEVELEALLDFFDGLLLEEGISLLQESYKRPHCTVILTGMRCTNPSGTCGEEDDPYWRCNQKVKIQMRGSNVTEEEIQGPKPGP